jgi:quercetin dioxygenase-like cupin family protein
MLLAEMFLQGESFMKRLFITSSLVFIVVISVLLSGKAQGGQRGQQTPEQAALQAARVGNSTGMELEGTVTQRRKFAPGTRTYWHSHDGGFIFFVQKGVGRAQRRGEPMKEMKEGDVDYTPPGVEHWHGAGANDELVQIGIVPGGGGIKFKEEVTDVQYNGKSK